MSELSEADIRRTKAYKLDSEALAAHIEPGTSVYVYADTRGESETYEAYSLVRVYPNGRAGWGEGIRKDRTHMFPAWRSEIERALAVMKGGV